MNCYRMYWIQQLTIVYKKKRCFVVSTRFVPYTLDSGRGGGGGGGSLQSILDKYLR